MQRGHITESTYSKELVKIVRMSGASKRNKALGKLNQRYFATRTK
jgi:hypothetical protein